MNEENKIITLETDAAQELARQEDGEVQEAESGDAAAVEEEVPDPGPLEIVIDDGCVRIPVLNKYREPIGEFYFRPTDMGIIERYNRLAGQFDEITKPLENISINSDGAVADEGSPEDAAALEEAKRRLFEACDFMFGGNMSEAFFGKMHPFSPVNGAFYCETAIEMVGSLIERYFEAETVRLSNRMKRHIRGYQPGKKKRGKK